ncbi:hypothetical protein DM794_06845 [Paenarthrobacter ureafaciens]|nr:hypothetical protein [Paenarthrobacter ureafaciens]NWL31949.1 hypothetical protein [Paenarthrobacter nitroguajacolicus]
MPMKDLVDVGQFALNCFLAVFTIKLFLQGQRDRRALAEDRRRDQAARVSLLVSQPHLKLPGASPKETIWRAEWPTLEICNDSDTAITNIMVFRRVSPSHVGKESEPEWTLLELLDDPIPTLIPYLGGGQVEAVHCTFAVSAHELELHFTDGAGLSWVKTVQNGQLWPKSLPASRWWSVWYQRLTQLPAVGKLFHWPIRYALRRIETTAPRIPWSVRLARFLWGQVPGPTGEPDPWRKPAFYDFPARDWPYQSLIWWVYYQREMREQRVQDSIS